jgi:hypothetical protein
VLPPEAVERTVSFDITFQFVKVLIDGHDSEGRLIFANDQLSAVIVRLDGEAHHPELKGQWHLEAGFGPCDARIAPPTFTTPEAAGSWVKQRLIGEGA